MVRYGEIWGDMGRYAELLERSEADAGDDWHLEAGGSEKVPRRLRDGSRLSGSTSRATRTREAYTGSGRKSRKKSAYTRTISRLRPGPRAGGGQHRGRRAQR